MNSQRFGNFGAAPKPEGSRVLLHARNTQCAPPGAPPPLLEPQTATQSSDQKFQENPKQPTPPRSKFQVLPTELEQGKAWDEFLVSSLALLPRLTPGCGTGMKSRWHWIPGCQTGRVWVSQDTGSSVPKAPRRDMARVGSSPRKGRHSHGPCSAHFKIHGS